MTDLDNFRRETRSWLEANCPPEMRRPMTSEEDTFWGGRNTKFSSEPQRVWFERMRDKGWTVPHWPKEYGGGGLDPEQAKILRQEMAALWNGVRRDSLRVALPAFFPEAAYVQVKAIGDPAADWSERLVRDYGLDLSAAHALLGAHPSRARLLRVVVPSAYIHWVDPGACYNGVGYYEVPNARVVYRQGEEVRSFGIASMISWRGVWYVVHLGAIVGPSGVVDDPSTGAGTSLPSSTC